jgi:hypothetical protein
LGTPYGVPMAGTLLSYLFLVKEKAAILVMGATCGPLAGKYAFGTMTLTSANKD